MKIFSPIIAITLIASFSWAQNPSSINYDCKPIAASSLQVGLNEVKEITSFKLSQSSSELKAEMSLRVITAEDLMNHRGGPLKETLMTESYSLKEAKSGTVLELSPDNANSLSFDSFLVQFRSIDVVTAGPIPEGTFGGEVNLILVSSYPENYNPQISALKVPAKCQVTIKY